MVFVLVVLAALILALIAAITYSEDAPVEVRTLEAVLLVLCSVAACVVWRALYQ